MNRAVPVMEDFGPPGSPMQVRDPNHRELRRLRAGVVSVTEKARVDGSGVRREDERE